MTNPSFDPFKGWPPIDHRTDEEWEALAREIVAGSGDPDGDVDALATALKGSAAREQAHRDEIAQGWIDDLDTINAARLAVEEEAYAMNNDTGEGA
ncbi:hypothetical protein GQ649_26090 [Rhodococcus sp. DSM 6344]|nr:hypothetical protein [Rhodococcus erythropolis]